MDENHRKYHAGKYPEYKGGPGQASYAEGSNTGYFENGLPEKSSEVDTKATKALRKILGVTKEGEKGLVGGLRTKKALEE